MNAPTNLVDVLERMTDYWSPKIVGRVNDQYVKLAKLKGELVWHSHEDEDELFYVMKGRLRIEFENGAVELGAGEFLTVPKGVRHNPVAAEECWVMLIESVTTKHTGEVETPMTRSIADQLA